MTLLFIAQILWYIAIIFSTLWFTAKKDKNALILMSFFNLFMGSHFLILWAYSGWFSLFFDILKNIFSLKYKNNIYSLVFFTTITCIIGYFTFDGTLPSLLPGIAPIVWTIWIFTLKGMHLRYVFLTCNILWILYNLAVWSLPWLIASSINMVAIFIGLWRVYKQQKYAK